MLYHEVKNNHEVIYNAYTLSSLSNVMPKHAYILLVALSGGL